MTIARFNIQGVSKRSLQNSTTHSYQIYYLYIIFCYSSSPDSLNAEKADNKLCPSTISPSALYKLVVPHLRCEVTDIKDAAVYAIGNINGSALRWCKQIFYSRS